MLFDSLHAYVTTLQSVDISTDRQRYLHPLLTYIQSKVTACQEIRLNFICTHNSRRSHLSQVWAQTLAYYYDLPNVYCYSGGTEATALYPMVAQTLADAGFGVQVLSNQHNPIYAFKYAANQHPIIGFSKTYDHPFNPQTDFAAIMSCDSAHEACPVVSGAEYRLPITYVDPKAYDKTPQQSQQYANRCFQIASELHFIFSQIEK